MSRRRRPARADRAPGAGPERPEARPGGAGWLRPLLAWLVAVGLLAVVVLGLRLGAGNIELLVRAPLWLVAAQAGGLVLGVAALVAAVGGGGVGGGGRSPKNKKKGKKHPQPTRP